MKIYTKTGDDGETGLVGGSRIRKDDIRIEAYGTVDELNAILGVARSEQFTPSVDSAIAQIQDDLFYIGAELATPDTASARAAGITDEHVSRLESAIDHHESELETLRHFILPGGCRTASLLHFARTVCRRSERRVLELGRTQTVSTLIAVYLNRLSDLLFVLARYENMRTSTHDVHWVPQ